jgi:predicted dehydrogenase
MKRVQPDEDAQRVLLVGCGKIANNWMHSALQMRRLRLVGLVDVDPQAAQKMARKHGLPAELVRNDLQRAIEELSPDVIFDVTVPQAHEQVVTRSLKAGCHVLGEKPMATSLEAARRMVAASESAGRRYAVMQNYRHRPQIRGLRALLASGRLGAIEELHADFYLGPHFGGFREAMAHPLLMDMAIHTFDAARYLSGADPVSVYCHSFNPARSWYAGHASAVAIFEMTDGCVFSYRGSWCAVGLNTSWNGQWRVLCTQGTATWDGEDGLEAQAEEADEGRRQMNDVPVEVPELPFVGHGGQIDDFLRSLDQGTNPETECHDNIKSLAMILAAIRSAEEGRKVEVSW